VPRLLERGDHPFALKRDLRVFDGSRRTIPFVLGQEFPGGRLMRDEEADLLGMPGERSRPINAPMLLPNTNAGSLVSAASSGVRRRYASRGSDSQGGVSIVLCDRPRRSSVTTR
jgi:hypothetical protein